MSNSENDFRSPLTLMLRMMRNPRLLLAGLIAYGGVLLVFAQSAGIKLNDLFARYGLTTLGVLLAAGGFLFMMGEMRKTNLFRERQFIDVDEQSGRTRTLEAVITSLRQDIHQMRTDGAALSEERLAELIRAAVPKRQPVTESATFVSYYSELKDVLQEKAANADAKASLLLDRGVGYSRLGIAFFVVSIIIWQALSWIHGFKVQFIYGMLSCSVLFVFIEFLSAWFLRQYAQFVETSTYLMKVKSIFDRYLLTYLASLDDKLRPTGENHALAGVLSILKDEIRWPDTYLLKQGDVSFAREVMESLASVTHALRTNTKESNAKKADAA